MHDIIQKMDDVIHFMEEHIYVGRRFISISYFSPNLASGKFISHFMKATGNVDHHRLTFNI